jgi:hypothetical protein
VISDHRVSEVTQAQRQEHAAELDRLSPREGVHFLSYRQREALNTIGGYWAAASSPKAAEEAILGTTSLPDLRMAAALTDVDGRRDGQRAPSRQGYAAAPTRGVSSPRSG